MTGLFRRTLNGCLFLALSNCLLVTAATNAAPSSAAPTKAAPSSAAPLKDLTAAEVEKDIEKSSDSTKCLAPFGDKPVELVSPDGKLRAIIKAQNKNDESLLEIQKADHTLHFKEDFSSKDKQHGLIALKAAWSPDSKFIYMTLTSSGGHSPWKDYAHFYSRDKNKVYDMEQFMQPMAGNDFHFEAPDVLHAAMWIRSEPEGSFDTVLPIRFRLSDIKPPSAAAKSGGTK